MHPMPLVTLLVALMLAPGGPQTGTMTIVVDNVRSSEGNLALSVFDSPETFMKETVRGVAEPVGEGAAHTFRLEDLPYGTYAFSIIHDENADGQLQMGEGGIPTEGYVFSNNTGNYGPPAFDAAKVAFDAEQDTFTVRLIYW